MGLFGDIVGGIGGAVGSFLGRDDRRSEADHAADRNDNAAREQMAFQERMSNSAYQRATTDMTKAGINPMVAFSQGGASTPSGAAGSAPLAAPTENALSKGISTAIDAQRLSNETKAQGSQQALNDALGTKALQDTRTSGASAKQMETNTKAVQSQLEAIAARAKSDAQEAKYDYAAGTYDAVAKRVNRDTNSAKNVMDILNPLRGKVPNGMIIHRKTGEILKP